jgi:hypothetical protein
MVALLARVKHEEIYKIHFNVIIFEKTTMTMARFASQQNPLLCCFSDA